MSWDLEAILDYKMSELEAKSFKLALLWEILAEKEFPGYHHVRLKKSGDPRKSHLFRICYKLVRETKGYIPDPEYRLYILAQLHVLKNSPKDALVDPSMLVGKKAWKRWKLWKYFYDRNVENHKQTIKEAKPMATLGKVATALKKTKDFFLKQYGREPTYDDIAKCLGDHSMVKWVTLQRVSPYYILLSPWVARILEGRNWEEVFLFDLSVYKESITENAEKFFKECFNCQ